MNEYAGLGIAIRIDMEIVSSSGYASADILTIILKVHRKEWYIIFRRPDKTYPVDHGAALYGRRHQFGNCVVAHRHIVEIEAEMGAF